MAGCQKLGKNIAAAGALHWPAADALGKESEGLSSGLSHRRSFL